MPPLHVKRTGGAAVVDSQRSYDVIARRQFECARGLLSGQSSIQRLSMPQKMTCTNVSAGLNVVRLIPSWSSLEPERGVIDESYIDRNQNDGWIRQKIRIYVSLDMHQDAWGKFIASSPDTQCGFLNPRLGGMVYRNGPLIPMVHQLCRALKGASFRLLVARCLREFLAKS